MSKDDEEEETDFKEFSIDNLSDDDIDEGLDKEEEEEEEDGFLNFDKSSDIFLEVVYLNKFSDTEHILLNSSDSDQVSFTLGLSEDCDIPIYQNKMPENIFSDLHCTLINSKNEIYIQANSEIENIEVDEVLLKKGDKVKFAFKSKIKIDYLRLKLVPEIPLLMEAANVVIKKDYKKEREAEEIRRKEQKNIADQKEERRKEKGKTIQEQKKEKDLEEIRKENRISLKKIDTAIRRFLRDPYIDLEEDEDEAKTKRLKIKRLSLFTLLILYLKWKIFKIEPDYGMEYQDIEEISKFEAREKRLAEEFEKRLKKEQEEFEEQMKNLPFAKKAFGKIKRKLYLKKLRKIEEELRKKREEEFDRTGVVTENFESEDSKEESEEEKEEGEEEDESTSEDEDEDEDELEEKKSIIELTNPLAGPVTRILSNALDGLFAYILILDQDITSFTKMIFDELMNFKNISLKIWGLIPSFLNNFFVETEINSYFSEEKIYSLFSYILVFILLQFLITFFFGNTFGQLIIGIRSSRKGLLGNIRSSFRLLIGIIISPLWFLDNLSLIFGKMSFKEFVSKSRLMSNQNVITSTLSYLIVVFVFFSLLYFPLLLSQETRVGVVHKKIDFKDKKTNKKVISFSRRNILLKYLQSGNILSEFIYQEFHQSLLIDERTALENNESSSDEESINKKVIKKLLQSLENLVLIDKREFSSYLPSNGGLSRELMSFRKMLLSRAHVMKFKRIKIEYDSKSDLIHFILF